MTIAKSTSSVILPVRYHPAEGAARGFRGDSSKDCKAGGRTGITLAAAIASNAAESDDRDELKHFTAADRKSWSSLSPITSLKCGITEGGKLDAIAKMFFLSAPPPLLPRIKWLVVSYVLAQLRCTFQN